MQIRFLVVIIFMTWSLPAQNNLDLNYYLPDSISYDPEIPKPKEVIGHEVGEWHVTHDKLLFYLRTLAKVSNRITIEERGQTFEGRPLPLLIITSNDNHQNLESIRMDHLKLSEASNEHMNVAQMPIVVYQGYTIHGNEPSGSNAVLAYAYYLAAAQGNAIQSLLKNMVILLDPCMNPDGLQRFANWVNIHKSQQLNPDSNDREYGEVWPGGRTNHYWFDMNRDWLPIQLPESRSRVKTFYQWLPNIVTDHHEMGTNSTYFFQPGEPSRVHPLTPKLNQELTKEIATYHARALDKIGSLYYSEENFDDHYYGKGSTFPDANGSIGILFEQGSSRGHIQESENGPVTFPFTIRNQLTTSLSTIEAAENMRVKILDYQKAFFRDLKEEASKNKAKAYIVGDAKDPAKTWHLAEILSQQKIKFHELKEDVTIEGKKYGKGAAYIVPMNQKNPKLLQAMFEKRTSFQDSLFYDVSAWTFPLSFNVDYTVVKSLQNAGKEVKKLQPLKGHITAKSNYAYLFEWHGYYTPRTLNTLLNKGLRAKVARTPFELEGRSYDYGTIMVPIQNQQLNSDELYQFFQSVAERDQIEIVGVSSGLTKGIDLGSNDFEPIKKQKVGLLVGDGVRPYDAGEIWHLFDTRYHMKISKLDTRDFDRMDLDKYTDLIIPSANGSIAFDKKRQQKLKDWVKRGGTLIGYRNIAPWLKNNGFMHLETRKDTLVAKGIRFDQKSDYFGAQVTGGAIFEATLDRSHPIAYGYKNDKIALFRNSNIYLEPEKDSFDNPIQYTNEPLLSGYISEENQALIKNSVPFKVKALGQGKVILFTDNTNFRGFWYGTNKLLMNAVFFATIM